jgi:hypothetical protein
MPAVFALGIPPGGWAKITEAKSIQTTVATTFVPFSLFDIVSHYFFYKEQLQRKNNELKQKVTNLYFMDTNQTSALI